MASDDLAKLGWITDRLPTAADADREGDVRILSKKEAGPTERWRWQNWGAVAPGQPWWSQKAAAAAASETGPATEADRIAALEQRVADHVAVNPEALAALEACMASDDLAKLGWITDRLPTAADADREGDVRILSKKEAGPTERIAALEQRVADHVAVNPEALAALESRMVELEATMRQLLHGSRFRLVVEPR